MTSFTLAGSAGANQTITNGNTLTIAAGNGITTTGGSTDTVTVAVTSPVVETDQTNTFTEDQTFEAITETQTTKSASFTPDLSNDGTIYSCTGTMTITMPSAEAGKSFTIIHSSGSSITWSGTIYWNGGSPPTAAAAIEIYVFVSDGANWYANRAGTGYA